MSRRKSFSAANSPGGEIRGQLGVQRPVDMDGDGRTDRIVLRFPSIAPPGVAPIAWWNLKSTAGVSVENDWGDANTDFPAPGDYDGDGRTDRAIYRPGATVGTANFYWILNSFSDAATVTQWGIRGDFSVNQYDSR